MAGCGELGQGGFYRGQKISDVFVFSTCSIICLRFLWFSIGLKWLIKTWGWIAIRFFSIFVIFEMLTKFGPLDPLLITRTL